jgi:two-component system, NarL family, sensor histidine kinase UhpB
MRFRTTLLTQVLAVNTGLVAITAFVAAIVARERFADATSRQGLLLIALAVFSAVLLNSLLLRHRLRPVATLVETMDSIDSNVPGARAGVERGAAREVQALTAGLNAMLERIETERLQAGRAVLRGQEQERQRIAQDLHDEVNQALTAILLRLEATLGDAPHGLRPELQETKQLVNQAMDELLQLARQLRPTALDDHGLIAALASQVEDFGRRTGIEARFKRHGSVPPLSDEEQLVIYRVTQESLSNVAQHAGARAVDVELSFVGRTLLRVRDDGRGFDGGLHGASGTAIRARGRPGGLGLSGMRERALLVGGSLAIFSEPGQGTTIELTMGGA